MDGVLWLIRKKYSDVKHISTETLAQWLSVLPEESFCDLQVPVIDSLQVSDGCKVRNICISSEDNSTKNIREPLENQISNSVVNESCQNSSSCKPKNQSAITLFDVRSEVEYEVSHLKGARRVDDTIDHEELTELLKECLGTPSIAEGCTSVSSSFTKVSEEPVKIVCYCSLGYRSSDLARKIKRQLENMSKAAEVYNLEGSIFKWANENREIIKSNGEKTSFVHPYNYTFGLTLREELRKYE